ncbi:MAG TPA: glycosyltransferase family 87 protein [Thermoanaerobaculia bacterium]|nr:glycosyltransferase family 87 protein [Thermoanaerobaculia bacterium]
MKKGTAWLLVIVLILLSEWAYVLLLLFEPRAHIPWVMAITAVLFGLYGALAFVVRRSTARALLPVIILSAILFRITLVPLGLPSTNNVLADIRADLSGSGAPQFRANLFLDDDVWRYLWDGHASAEFGNPYLAAPGALVPDPDISDQKASDRWQVIRARVNHPELPTIYPPLTQAVFFVAHAVAPGSVVGLKLLFIGCDLLGILIIVASLRRLGHRASDVMLYALNPLVILMFSGAAHVDVVMVTLLSATFYLLMTGSARTAGILLGLAILAKLTPIILLPLFARRLGKVGVFLTIATLAVFSAPFILATGGGLDTFAVFARNWDFNSASFESLDFIASRFTRNSGQIARDAAAVALAGTLLWIWRRTRSDQPSALAEASADTIGALLLFSPTVMPWYATWTLGFAPLTHRATTWIAFSALVCLSFPMMMDWKTDLRWLTAEYGALAIVALLEWRRAANVATEP